MNASGTIPALYVCFLQLGLLLAVISAENCGRFEFPTVDKNEITAREHTTLTVPFRLNTTNCQSPGDFSISVTQSVEAAFRDHCRIIHANHLCVQPTQTTDTVCQCPGEQGMYVFSKNVSRQDNASWIWWTNPREVAEKAEIFFNIVGGPSTPPATTGSLPSVNNLTLYYDRFPQPAHPGDQVDVICKWENGDPPVRARLLDREGEEIKDSSEQVEHVFKSVGCQDAGVIRCEAPGAIQNRSETLLVLCKPEFQKIEDAIARSGKDAELRFPVRTHTTKVNSCVLKKVSENEADSHDQDRDCSSTSSLTGTPPDLMLTVRLDDVKKEEEGQWLLELTNDVGTGHVDFELKVSESTGEETESDTTEATSGVDVHLIGGLVIGVNVGTVIIVTIVVLIIGIFAEAVESVSINRNRKWHHACAMHRFRMPGSASLKEWQGE